MENGTDRRYFSMRLFLTTMWNSNVKISPLFGTLIFTHVGDKFLFAAIAAQILDPVSPKRSLTPDPRASPPGQVPLPGPRWRCNFP
ncbi:hypothetical protein IWQ51_000415 [Labrenzia sp. EL_142]|nr:hypothetical protein [Labrenzia sp. EL_142]